MTKAEIEALLVRPLAVADARHRLPPPALRRLARVRAGVTQADVARALGVARPTVARWEAGTREPRGELLVAYLEALDVLGSRRRERAA